jgi:GNAT superfamily N-acetyltransferase
VSYRLGALREVASVGVSAVSFRLAEAADADSVAGLHAASWRRFYRGAYTDAFLDGDVLADRREVWSGRLTMQGPGSVTVLAEADGELVGFIHLVLDEDDKWGSFVDNLHVTHTRHGHGIGSALITRAAQVVRERGTSPSMYLWVLEQNTAAQAFYCARGGRSAERAFVQSPAGVPNRIDGRPVKLRFVWPDVRELSAGSRGR